MSDKRAGALGRPVERADALALVTESSPDENFVTRASNRWRDLVERVRLYSRNSGAVLRNYASPICLSMTLAGIATWASTFVALGVDRHRNFHTLAYDMAIWDQAFWLVSRGETTWMTVRGMDVWGQHLTLVAYAFVPFYRWFGAGPEFLYVVQNTVLALGALPVYLIAKDRIGGLARWWSPYAGLAFAIAYLLYTPTQFIARVNFHPEAMVITPFLFAWYFAQRRRCGWFFTMILLALSMREDTALAVAMLGIVLVVVNRHSPTRRTDHRIGLATVALGVVWYAVATRLVLPHFNEGQPPWYLAFHFRRYGGSLSGIVGNAIRHPDWVIRDAMQPDSLRLFRYLTMPLGLLALASPLHLLMAAPQLLASVTSANPYPRDIRTHYSAVMIAPILIAAIEGGRNLRRIRSVRHWVLPWLLVFAFVSNVAWSPSPLNARSASYWRDHPRADAFQAAVDIVPGDAVVSSNYLASHLSRRESSYVWPNPFAPEDWANSVPGMQDCTRFPSASVVEYLALDRTMLGDATSAESRLLEGLTAPRGQFKVIFDRENVIVARRVSPGPDGEETRVNCPGDLSTALELNGIEVSD